MNIVKITGPRQSGKTTALIILAEKLLKEGDKVVFVCRDECTKRTLEKRFTEIKDDIYVLSFRHLKVVSQFASMVGWNADYVMIDVEERKSVSKEIRSMKPKIVYQVCE